jgi:membrane peptidoglycan carboxypeptidase
MILRLIARFRGDLNRICLIVADANRRKVSLPRDFVEIILTLEDKNFSYHGGFDLKAGMRASIHFLIGRPNGGASTIDMQLARTITGFRAKTLIRKCYEITLAISLNRQHSKEDILFAYLTLAYFGTGLTGYQAASRKLFDREVAGLTLEEKAQLAALLRYPAPRDLNSVWNARVQRRARYGLSRCLTVQETLRGVRAVPQNRAAI